MWPNIDCSQSPMFRKIVKIAGAFIGTGGHISFICSGGVGVGLDGDARPHLPPPPPTK